MNSTEVTPKSQGILKKLEPGDIVLVSARRIKKITDLASCAIRLANFTRKGFAKRYWTHSALYLGDNKVIEAFPMPVGIVVRDIAEEYLDNSEVKLKILRLKYRTNAERHPVAQKARELAKEKSYDLIALSYFVLSYVTPAYLSFILEDEILGKYLNAEDKYFCSELVADSLLHAGVYCFDREPYQIMPAHFDNDLIFDVVAESPMRQMGWILRLPERIKQIGYLLSLAFWIMAPFLVCFGIIAYVWARIRNKRTINDG